MTTTTDLLVTITVETEKLHRRFGDLSYSIACMHLSQLRLQRALWPTLPLWKRVWLTYQRKGW